MSPNEPHIRWSTLSEEQKKNILKARNAKTAKSARQKRHAEEDRISSLFQDNDRRIDRLEKTVEELSKELSKPPKKKTSEGSSAQKPRK